MLEKFETIYQKVCHKLDNPFRKTNFFSPGDKSIKALWNSMSNEKMIGILHAFILLRPTIDKAIAQS